MIHDIVRAGMKHGAMRERASNTNPMTACHINVARKPPSTPSSLLTPPSRLRHKTLSRALRATCLASSTTFPTPSFACHALARARLVGYLSTVSRKAKRCV
ncbi:hypothetical protein HGRIS_001397 [Hohenbuehelia grisea]